MSVAVLGMVALVHSAPQADSTIVRSENENPGNGIYQWAFETSDGTKQDANGQLRDGPLEDGTNGQFQVVEGSYSYTSPDGKRDYIIFKKINAFKMYNLLFFVKKGRLITVTYTSDEKGYRAKTTYA